MIKRLINITHSVPPSYPKKKTGFLICMMSNYDNNQSLFYFLILYEKEFVTLNKTE